MRSLLPLLAGPGCLTPRPLCLPPAAFAPSRVFEVVTFRFTEVSGQGLLEGDFACPGSLEAGRCVFTNFADGILQCYASGGSCKSVTIYMNGERPCAMLVTVVALQAHALTTFHCMRQLESRALFIHAAGTDGCSSTPVVVLSSASPTPDNTFVAQGVSTLLDFDPILPWPWCAGRACWCRAGWRAAFKPPSGCRKPGVGASHVAGKLSPSPPYCPCRFLYESEGRFLPPTEAELAANSASLAANGTAWYGCVLGQCVASGKQVALEDGVASPEDCCRLCSQRYEGSAIANASVPCNAWNHCDRDEGCAWAGSKDNPTPLRLTKGQCELRWQEISDIHSGLPLFVMVRGKFAAGATRAASVAATMGCIRCCFHCS